MTLLPFRMRILIMDHSVCRARQYYFSNLRIECCCYNFSESVNSHSFICPTAKVHLWVWKWDQNIFEVKFELLLKFKRPPIIFRNSCQISSFPPFFYAKFNLIGLNEGKSAFNLYNIKKSLLFFLNFHSVDCWLKVLYNISWNENYNFQCNFRNILAPKIVSRRLPIEYYCLASFLIQDQISAQATQKILTKNGRWTCFETCHFRINVHNRYVYLHIWKYIFLELADWQI